jgi:hypothetical protein
VTGVLRAVSGDVTTGYVFAVGDGGAFLISPDNGASWAVTTQGVLQNLRGVWAYSDKEAWVAGDAYNNNQPLLRYYNGVFYRVNDALFFATNAIHGYGVATFLAVGTTGHFARYSVGNLVQISPLTGTTDLNSALAFPPPALDIDSYAVGNAGTMYHLNYAGWTPLPSPTGTAPNLHGIHGTVNTDVYVVGDGGTIWHLNKLTVTALSSGVTSNLNAVWALSDGNVYTVGAGGTILHFRPMTAPN